MPIVLAEARKWFSADSADQQARVAAAWKDAPLHNAELLGMLLAVAREQVLEYAPDGTPYERFVWFLDGLGYDLDTIQSVALMLDMDRVSSNPPIRYLYAQLQQAKNLWNAGRVAANGEAGADGFSFAPRPLDKDIQRIIRPTAGVASVF